MRGLYRMRRCLWKETDMDPGLRRDDLEGVGRSAALRALKNSEAGTADAGRLRSSDPYQG
jgi:hypothetical protein